MAKRNEKPKGLKLLCQEREGDYLTVKKFDHLTEWRFTVAGDDCVVLDADQLDKLAERCLLWSKYLRSLPKSEAKTQKWVDIP